MEGVEDIPGTALHEGITWGWESFPEYLDVIDSTPHAIDFGAQVPHAALRSYVMGDRGADHAEVPTDAEIATMGRLAAEAIAAGAIGFSTSRTVAHRSSDGSPTPSLTATADELLGIARAIGDDRRGRVRDHLRPRRPRRRVRAHAGDGGGQRPTDVDHHAAAPGAASRRVPRAPRTSSTKAVADGVQLRGQVAARPDRHLDDARRPSAPAPRVAHVPAAARGAAGRRSSAQRLRDPEVRATVLARARRRRDAASASLPAPRSRSASQPRYDRRPDEVARPRRRVRRA